METTNTKSVSFCNCDGLSQAVLLKSSKDEINYNTVSVAEWLTLLIAFLPIAWHRTEISV